MASNVTARYIFCQECCRYVDILHNDVRYSTFTHIGTHRPLRMIDQEVNGQVIITRARADNKTQKGSNFCCPICNENIVVFGSDISFCLRQHAQTHSTQRAFVPPPRSEDLSSNSSNRSKAKSTKSNPNNKANITNNKIRNVPKTQNIPQMGPQLHSERVATQNLNTIFKLMPLRTHRGLKNQRGFLLQVSERDVYCKICNNCKIEPFRNQVEEHLKSKRHEDNIIVNIKNNLPPHLQDEINSLSIHYSNLSCKNCKCKIDLDSYDIKRTIQNITEHSSSPSHLNQNPKVESIEAGNILKSLAYLDKTIGENKMYIEAKMQPLFKCTLCNKHIEFDSNQSVLMKNFNSHLNSSSHNKCVLANAFLEVFRKTFSQEMENHNLVIHKNSIFCFNCKCTVETSFEKLVMHVKGINNLAQINNSVELIARLENFSVQEPSESTKEQSVEEPNSQVQQNPPKGNRFEKELHALLKTLPKPFKNITYIVKNQPYKVRCLFCKCNVAANTNQLKLHLRESPHPTSDQVNTLPTPPPPPSPPTDKVKKDNSMDLQILLNSLPSKFGVLEYIVESGNGQVTCLVCNCIIPATTVNLQGHLEGSKHIKNVNSSSDEQPKTEVSQINPPASASSELGNSSEAAGNQYKSMVGEKGPTVPLDHFGNNFGMKSSLEKPDFIKELFSKLPLNYQRDMRNIEKSNKVEGFVQCTLCKHPSINPYYLREHLNEKEHMDNLFKEEQFLNAHRSENNLTEKSKKHNILHANPPKGKSSNLPLFCESEFSLFLQR